MEDEFLVASTKQEEGIDILHPLTILHWEECQELPEGIDDTRCVKLNGKLYVSGRFMSSGNCAKIYQSSPDLNTWTTVATPTYWFALATFKSQLVLLGGMEASTDEMTRKVWAGDGGGQWDSSLPQLMSLRSAASAVNVGSPECLILAGGERKDFMPCTLVEVLAEGQWLQLEPLPKRCYDIKFSCHNGMLHLMGGHGQDSSFMYWCKVSSIQRIVKENKSESRKFPLWNRSTLPLMCSSSASFGKQLIVFGVLVGLDITKVYAYENGSKIWVHVGNLPGPMEIRNLFTLNFSAQQLVVIGVDDDTQRLHKRKLFKLSLRVSAPYLSNRFTMSSLARIEGVLKINVVSSLLESHDELVSTAKIIMDKSIQERLQDIVEPHVYIELIIDRWVAGGSTEPPIWSSLLEVLRRMDLEDISIDIEDFLNGKLKYLEAYRKVVDTRECLNMWFVKVVFLGASRMGKTAACRRLSGVMTDIYSSGQQHMPSTGVVELGQNIIIKNLTGSSANLKSSPTEWCVSKDLDDEACTLLQYLYGQTQRMKQSPGKLAVDTSMISSSIDSMYSPSDGDVSHPVANVTTSDQTVPHKHGKAHKVVTVLKNVEAAMTFKEHVEKKESKEESADVTTSIQCEQVDCDDVEMPSQSSSSKDGVSGSSSSMIIDFHGVTSTSSKNKAKKTSEVHTIFRKAMSSRHWKDVKSNMEDMVLLKIEDTGGQPEFMDMLPVFTIGPALYLLFCKLTDPLHGYYTESYLSPTGVSTVPEPSAYTVEEVLLRALASISNFNASPSESEFLEAQSKIDDLSEPFNKSIAYIVGTHKDVVSERQINKFDMHLQECIKATEFHKQNLVQFASKKRMILPIDNMRGGDKEMDAVRNMLEEGIKNNFKKLSIPASWLVLSLCLRMRQDRVASLESVLKLAKSLSISFSETKLALWFLHHYAGSIMFFPNLTELKHMVICDIQVVYDSITKLIVNTFKFGPVEEKASKRFRETGHFTLRDIEEATASISGDYIPLHKLIRLLEHLNIISSIHNVDPFCPVTYFMPCIVQNAAADEIDLCWEDLMKRHAPAPLLIRYPCGYSPIGIFPAMAANLAGRKTFDLVIEGIRKNIIQFHYGSDSDIITFFSLPTFYAVFISRSKDAQMPTHTLCKQVRNQIDSALHAVTSRMNYSFCIEYQLGFHCTLHPGRNHVCTIDLDDLNPCTMSCTCSGSVRKVTMDAEHLVWFDKPFNDVARGILDPIEGRWQRTGYLFENMVRTSTRSRLFFTLGFLGVLALAFVIML